MDRDKSKRGCSPILVTPELREILLPQASLRPKAKMAGISYGSVRRKTKKLKKDNMAGWAQRGRDSLPILLLFETRLRSLIADTEAYRQI